MKSFTINPQDFDGAKFTNRYGFGGPETHPFKLQILGPNKAFLIVYDDKKLTDDPPIFDPPDTPAQIAQKQKEAAANQDLARGVLIAAALALVDEIAAAVPSYVKPTKDQLSQKIFGKV